jgi:hypothetical protein
MLKPIAGLVGALVAVSSAAHAEPIPTRYVQGDLMVGASAPATLDAMVGVEGGVRATEHGWWHGGFALGPAGDDQGSGKNAEVRAGYELRGCKLDGIVCATVGADLGARRGTWHSQDTSAMEQVTSIGIMPALGVDVGSPTLRFGIGVHGDVALASVGRPPGAIDSLQLATGVAYRW